ncbi:oligosaccharide biosynthesis protein Alg14 [Pontibacter populi]|uniref:Oligosaccharide biosynthesis protein Alg14 n=1 Tax=Pontibacter populi TaxID=890055 RepID=A0ABV1RY54_9BACT
MRILAIASAGGHWIQLLRLKPAFAEQEVIFVSTKQSFSETVKEHDFYSIPNASRQSKLRLIYMAFCVAKLILSLKPDIVITTGAAPGLLGIMIGKILGLKTLWVDSIANVERVSLSGKIAIFFADNVYTQWPHLATSKIKFSGSVL